MDPNRYQVDEYGQQPYDDLNNALLMHPEEIMEDPAWYNEFDYTDQAWDAAGPSTEYCGADEEQCYADEDQCYADEGGAAAGSSDKGKGKGKVKDHKSSKDKGKPKVKETEYRFKDDLPNPADWDCYRETIRELYLTKKLSLRDVIEVMKETHSFAAT